MALFLTVHARYRDVQWGLFDEGRLLISSSVESKSMNAQFIELLDTLLKKRSLTLHDLSYIAVHQGPAPFTTLRVCIATVNGIAFATDLPLVGINGLDALLDEYCNKTPSRVHVALLNAFGDDLYYGIQDHSGVRSFGSAQGEQLLVELKERYTEPLLFLGNGSSLFSNSIQHLFADQAEIITIDMVSLEHLGLMAHHQWKRKETVKQVMPLYLKNYTPPVGPSTSYSR